MVRTKQTARKSTANKQTSFGSNLQTARKSTARPSESGKDTRTGYAKKSCTTVNVSTFVNKQATINVDEDVNPPGGYRHPPGALALKEIRYYQNSTGFLVPRLPFQRLVRSICQELDVDVRFHVGALEAFQVFIYVFFLLSFIRL